MKQLLVLIAVLPLLLVFFVQFSLDQINNSRLALFADYVYAAKEEAKQEGCFTQEIVERLSENIALAFNIAPSDVVIQASDTVQYRVTSSNPLSTEDLERGLIYYKVSVPIAQIMAGRKLFGIREEDNSYYYSIESYAASERLP